MDDVQHPLLTAAAAIITTTTFPADRPWNDFVVSSAFGVPATPTAYPGNVDEILQLIYYELPDPSPLTLVSRRLHTFSQDPYVRARYFLTHYGPTEAMYYALGRGKVLTERVIDVRLPPLLSRPACF